MEMYFYALAMADDAISCKMIIIYNVLAVLRTLYSRLWPSGLLPKEPDERIPKGTLPRPAEMAIVGLVACVESHKTETHETSSSFDEFGFPSATEHA